MKAADGRASAWDVGGDDYLLNLTTERRFEGRHGISEQGCKQHWAAAIVDRVFI